MNAFSTTARCIARNALAAAAATLALSGASQANPVTFGSTGSVFICDLCTVTSTINVTQHLQITDLNVVINSLSHTWDSDLVISLFAPGGQSVLLSNRRGGSGDGYFSTVFDDSTAAHISSGSAPFTGSFRPEGLLTTYNNTDAFGLWTLQIADTAGADVGSINQWSLSITGVANPVPQLLALSAAANPVPEPGSLALVGAALAAAAALRRRRA